ncbi:CASP-like protein [Quillaja saponaria]|uniref:CASP-like protein n=1 Tax=Quillaja saponaria TaxID=32244 RepID=A0AAD7VIH7_QUISA|nr:CASP-like protein [Quillaja saponaria]
MNLSRPSVHPVEAPPFTDAVAVADDRPLLRMKDLQGMPGTLGGLVLRIFQLVFAVVSLFVMASTSDFPSVTAFRYLVAVVSLQSLWSLSLAVVDVYCLLVRRRLRNCRFVCLFTIGDGITSTLTFAAACSSAGITILIDPDLNKCHWNHRARFETATAMAFLSWFSVSPSFLLNFWSLASH